jgi:hypothetical protein
MSGFYFAPLEALLTEHAEVTGQHDSAHTIDRLRRDVERLYMITHALWSILKDRYKLEDEDLVKLITAVDMQDGRMDGRVAPSPPQSCPQCGRVLSRRHAHCIYCGAVTNNNPFAR